MIDESKRIPIRPRELLAELDALIAKTDELSDELMAPLPPEEGAPPSG